MDEKERLEESREPEQDENNSATAELEDAAEIIESMEDAEAEDNENEPILYFGRFTPGVWHGGVLGLALDFILIGVCGLINSRFSLGMDDFINSPWFKYGLLICLVYGLGKLGGYLEKKREKENQE